MIIRNLGFDLREKHLRGQFARFGPITAIDVPLNQTNNQNRGFGFIEFEHKTDAQRAITEMSGQKWKGRAITVEFSLPKNSYETKVQHVLDNTNQTKQEVIRPKSVKQELKDKPEVVEAKPEPAPKPKREKESADTKNESTLFVRNIGWDVTERQFKEHMEQFGPVHYAVLCKAARDMKVDQIESQETHKGTGFVRFKKVDDAMGLVELSRKLEEQLDMQHRSTDKKKGKKEDTIIGKTSLLKGELELNGRLLKIMPQVARTSVDQVLQ